MQIKDELKNALESLKAEIKGKTNEEVKSAIDSFEEKYKENVANEVKSVKDELDKEIKALQDQADKLQIKLQESVKAKENENIPFVQKALKDNFEEIKKVGGKKEFSLEVKDMTLGNALTGDQPRDYNFDVVRRESPIINVEDLASSIQISGGTYTYTRSTLASGSVATQTEGSDKEQLEYDLTMVDANTDYIAGFAVYSKKMRNNLPFLESTLSADLRDDYYRGENSAFQTILAAQATTSTQSNAGQNKAEALLEEMATLADINVIANGIVLTPSDYFSILEIEKSTGAGYGLPLGWTFENNQLRCMGAAVYMAPEWLPANKYYIGDWSRVRKVVTEGFSFAVSEDDSDNFRKNNITARVEAQVTLTVEKPDSLRYGDFTTA
jgi:HK97 family phage major capsid protein